MSRTSSPNMTKDTIGLSLHECFIYNSSIHMTILQSPSKLVRYVAMTEPKELVLNLLKDPPTGYWNSSNHSTTKLVRDLIQYISAPNVANSEYILVYEGSYNRIYPTIEHKTVDIVSVVRVDLRASNLTAIKSMRDEVLRILNTYNKDTSALSPYSHLKVINRIDKSPKGMWWWIYEVEVVEVGAVIP